MRGYEHSSPCILQWYGTSLLGLEIPAPSNAIDVCASRHQSVLIGGDGNLQSPQGHLRPEDYRLLSRGAKAIISGTSKKKRRAQSSERSDLLMVGGANEVSDGQPPRICSVEPYQITNALNLSESTYSGTITIPSLLLSEIKVRSYSENNLLKEEGENSVVPYNSTIEWKPYDGKRPSKVRSLPRVQRSKAMDHPFSGQVK